MARLTGSEFVDMLRDMLGGENEQTLSETRLLRWLNQAHMEVVALVKPTMLSGSETITTVAGTAEYTFSSDNVMTIDDCINTTVHQPLFPITENQYNQFNLGGTQQGSPSYYFNSGSDSTGKTKITFWPIPADVYSIVINITKKPTALIATAGLSNTTQINEIWDDSILYRAARRGWYSLGDPAQARAMMEAAQANDTAAWRATNMLSELGYGMSSPVGRALRNG